MSTDKYIPRISVIIVNWNVAEALNRCLASVFATHYPDLEVIVIDNASSDNSLSIVNRFKSVKLIKNSDNVGFPKAVNQGLAASSGDFILLLNPDTRIPKNFFSRSVRFIIDHPDCSIMGAGMLDPDGTIQGSVFPDSSIVNTFKEYWLGQSGLTQKYVPFGDQPSVVFAVSGGCMFMPKATIDRFGVLTDRVFAYFEDMEYCRRVNRGGGKVYFNPQIKIIHEHGQSFRQTDREKYRNFLESLIYPFRKLFHVPNRLHNFQRYQTESGIWYNGWFKHTLIAFLIWSSQKFRK